MQSIFHKSFKSPTYVHAVKNTICRYPKDISERKREHDKVFNQLKHKIHLKLLQLSEEVETSMKVDFPFDLSIW